MASNARTGSSRTQHPGKPASKLGAEPYPSSSPKKSRLASRDVERVIEQDQRVPFQRTQESTPGPEDGYDPDNGTG